MILTENQAAVYDFITSEHYDTGEPVTIARVYKALGIRDSTAHDRINALVRKGALKRVEKCGRTGFLPLPITLGAEEEKNPRAGNLDHGMSNGKQGVPKNPLTWEEVAQVKAGIKYRNGKNRGTVFKVLKRYEVIEEIGQSVRQVYKVEALKPYPHGVLCTGRNFIRWVDIALYMRNPKKAIGERYWKGKGE